MSGVGYKPLGGLGLGDVPGDGKASSAENGTDGKSTVGYPSPGRCPPLGLDPNDAPPDGL